MSDRLLEQLGTTDGPADPGTAFRERLWAAVDAELHGVDPTGASTEEVARPAPSADPHRRRSRTRGALAWIRASRARTVPVAAAVVTLLSLGAVVLLQDSPRPDSEQTVEVVDDPTVGPSGPTPTSTPGALGPPAVVGAPTPAGGGSPSSQPGTSAVPRPSRKAPAAALPSVEVRPRPWELLYSALTPNSGNDFDVYTAVAGSEDSPRVLIGGIAYNAAPVYSPDRRLLAWTNNEADHEVRSIWLANADGTQPRRLPLAQCPVQLECDYDFATFESSGSRLAFTRSTANSSCTPAERCDEIMVYDLRSGGLSAVAYGSVADWSPRRAEIVYAGSSGPTPRSPCEATNCLDREIRIVDVSRGDRPSRRVGEVTGSLPRFSPDGEWIAFIRAVGSGSEGAVMRRDGSQLRDLGGCQQPSWAPDGRLACVMSVDGGRDVFMLDADDEPAQRLTFTPGINEIQVRLYQL